MREPGALAAALGREPAQPAGQSDPSHSTHSTLLDGGAVGELLAGPGDQLGEAARPAGRALDPSSRPGRAPRRISSRRGRASVARRGAGLLAGPERAGEGAYVGRVEAAEGRGQQRLGPVGADEVVVVGVLDVGVRDHAERAQQRQHGGLPDQRGLVAGDLDGHPGRGQRPAQGGDAAAPRPDQHRHLGPADAVLEVGAPQQVGDVLGLGAGGVEGEHVDRAGAELVAGRLGRAEGGVRLGRDRAGDADGGGDRCGRRAAAGTRSGGWCRARRRGPGRPSEVRNSAGKSRIPRTSAPRKP